MDKRKTPSLACGDYVSGNPKDNLAVLNVQLRLLDAIERIYPAMLQALKAEVFPVYSHLASRVNCFVDLPEGDSGFMYLARQKELKDALSKWAYRFQVNAEWLL